MEDRYKIICYSKSRAAISMFLPMAIIVAVLFPLFIDIFGKTGEFIGGGLGILIGLYCFFQLPKYIARRVLEIVLDKQFIRVCFVRPYILENKIKPDLYISYDDIQSYKHETSYNFHTFHIRLKNGTKFRIDRWYNDDDDQFDRFFSAFEKKVKNISQDLGQKIEKEKLLMENKTVLVIILVLILIVLLSAIILIFKKGIQNLSGIVFLLMVFGPLCWAFVQVLKGLRR